MKDIDRLLDDAERHRWPTSTDAASWAVLANWAFQTECLQVDEAENLAWEQAMRELLRRELPYEQFVSERMAALKVRLRARKLAQARLRYRYGFKPTKPHLIRRNVRRFYAAWSVE